MGDCAVPSSQKKFCFPKCENEWLVLSSMCCVSKATHKKSSVGSETRRFTRSTSESI